MNLTRQQAHALWYVTATGGFTDQIAEAMGVAPVGSREGFRVHLELMRLRMWGLVDYGLCPYGTVGWPQWYLTAQGLKEHERRMKHAKLRMPQVRG